MAHNEMSVRHSQSVTLICQSVTHISRHMGTCGAKLTMDLEKV